MKVFYAHLRQICICCVRVFSLCQLYLVYIVKSSVFLFIFCLVVQSFIVIEILMAPTYYSSAYFSLQIHQLCFICYDDLLLGSYMFIVVISTRLTFDRRIQSVYIVFIVISYFCHCTSFFFLIYFIAFSCLSLCITVLHICLVIFFFSEIFKLISHTLLYIILYVFYLQFLWRLQYSNINYTSLTSVTYRNSGPLQLFCYTLWLMI